MNARINWMAKRLESVRGNITKDVFSNLIRAACLLYGIRRFIDKQEGNSPVTPLDVGGEYLRFLGLQVAGANQPFAKELAKIAISTCENFPDILPSDDFWGVLMNDERFGKSGQALFTSQDLHAAQLMIERTISDHYRDSTRVKLFKIS
jgi:hypothetical protein